MSAQRYDACDDRKRAITFSESPNGQWVSWGDYATLQTKCEHYIDVAHDAEVERNELRSKLDALRNELSAQVKAADTDLEAFKAAAWDKEQKLLSRLDTATNLLNAYEIDMRALESRLRAEEEAHAALQTRCYDDAQPTHGSIFAERNELRSRLEQVAIAERNFDKAAITVYQFVRDVRAAIAVETPVPFTPAPPCAGCGVAEGDLHQQDCPVMLAQQAQLIRALSE